MSLPSSSLILLATRYMQDNQIQVLLLGGDQQTLSRVLWLRRKNQDGKYNQIVPFVGDFHSAVHMLMAVHILWYVVIVSFSN